MTTQLTTEVTPSLNYRQNVDIKIHLQSTRTFYGLMDSTPETLEIKEQMRSAEYSVEYYFINNTYKDITVMNRDGLAVTVKHKPCINNPNFIIRKVITFRNTGLKSAIACISSMRNITDDELLKIKQVLSNIDIKKFTDTSLMLDYPISIEDISVDKNSTIYHYQTDTVVSLLSSTEVSPHPYSSRFVNIGMFGLKNEYEFRASDDFHLKIRYVNHSRTAGPKFIKIAGQVKQIFPDRTAVVRVIKLPTFCKNKEYVGTDYVEVITTAKNNPSFDDDRGVISKKYSLEDAKTILGMYDTYLEATTNGDIDSVRKRELADLEHQLSINKLKLQQDKLEADKELDNRKAIINNQLLEIEQTKLDLQKERNILDRQKHDQEERQKTLDAEILALQNQRRLLEMQRSQQDNDLERERQEHTFQLKQEQIKWQDYYEAKTQVRKEVSEFVKFIPGLVIAFGGIIAVYAKFSKNKD
jgi:hypothetical protein